MAKTKGLVPAKWLLGAVLLIVSASVPSGALARSPQAADSLAAEYDRADNNPVFDPDGAGLGDYLARAALHNPALRAAFYEWVAALEKAGYAGSLPEPRFVYSYFIENVETRVGPQIQRFGIQQSFPWFGSLGAKEDIATEAANAAWQRFQSQKLKLFYEVKTAYYDYYYLGRDIAITRENLELLTFWESVARAKYRVALKQHPDVIKVQVELGKLEDHLRTVEDKTGPVAARLRAAANLPDSVGLPLPAEIDVPEEDLHRDDVIARVLDNNPDLKSLVHLIEKAQGGRRLAGKSSWPDLFVGVDYIDVGEAVIPGTPDSGKDAFTASVGISLPLWFGANKAKKQDAEAQYRKAQYNLVDAQNQLIALAEQIIFKHEDALRKTRLYRDGLVPKAEQSLNANYTAYQAGETDFLNLLDAQRQLLDFQLLYERSRSNLAIGRAEIEMVTGTSLQSSGNRISK